MSISIKIDHPLADFDLSVDFSIDGNATSAIFGPSGAGKSTLINILAGLEKPARGHIAINGRIVEDTATKTTIAPQHRKIGYVFQQPHLFPHLTVEKNLLFGWRRTKSRASQAEIQRLIELLGINNLLKRKPRALSGGEKQRVALGRALLTNPDLLLLDEPLAALDHKRRDEILPYIEKIRHEQQIPMLYVSHSIDEVTRIADHVHVINEGKIVANGTISEVFSRVDLYPITGRFEAGAIIDGAITRHRQDEVITEISFGSQFLTVPLMSGEVGESVRVRVRARDIIIAKQRPEQISANNIFKATILDIRQTEDLYADLQLQCDATRLLARITRHSAARLDIAIGSEVYAVIKSVTIDRKTLRQ